MKKVLLMTVSKDRVEPEAWDSWLNQDYPECSILLHVLKPKELNANKQKNRSLNIAVNREIVRKMALTSDADYFVFVDGDIVLPPHAISELTRQLETMKAHAIAGYYLMRDNKTQWCMGRLVKDNTIWYLTKPEKSVVKVDYAGTGCMLVSRKLLKKTTIKTDLKRLLKVAGMKNHYVWADLCWDLCNQIFKLGYQLYADGEVVCKHLATNKNIQQKPRKQRGQRGKLRR